ncbi:MAG TPA: peptidase [Planctomycetota bacterium]|jgi:putative proteasome-type protease|nr:peptidase [Planctomycetota bacterium]
MTFCIAMKVAEGLVGLADTRITSGAEQITARKVTVHQYGRHSMFLMTSGLRSVRDKTLTYFSDSLENEDQGFDKLYKAVNAFAAQIRRVAREDKKALSESGLQFNLHAIVGGQLEKDKEHKLYLIYPQANWVEVSMGTPYYVIGSSAYGKPLLDRCLTYNTSMETALKLGYLAFDATRTAATDVGFPLDVVLYRRGTFKMAEHRYNQEDLTEVSAFWQDHMRKGVDRVPSDWVNAALKKLPTKQNGK